MRAAVAGRRRSAPVRMSAGQLATLAVLIEQLADRCGVDEQVAGSWPDGAEQTASGFRSWVPLQHFEAVRRRIEAYEAEVQEARSQLEAREADNIRLTSLAFGVHPAV